MQGLKDKKVLKMAMEILIDKLKEYSNVERAFDRTINYFNQPPVLTKENIHQKKPYDDAKEVVEFIQKIITPFLTPKVKPSREQKIELWDNLEILKNLDKEYANVLLKLIETHNPRSLTELTSLERLSNPYKYSVNSTEERRKYHAMEIDPSKDSSKFQNLRKEFRELKGDYLKTKILEDFKNQIEKVSTERELTLLKEKLLNSDEYAVLKTSQGLFTKITGRPTSSMKAFETMFNAQEEILKREAPKMNNEN